MVCTCVADCHVINSPNYMAISSLNECGDVGESPASLILVIGSSLSVLRNYAFLWPVGLGRCVGENPRTSRKRTRRVAKSASRDDSHTDGDGRCHERLDIVQISFCN
uniref:Secreted protein n=1 Tax=Mesocestoides corti TaxID=53468 RepID=A0A5K3FR27_MESCO